MLLMNVTQIFPFVSTRLAVICKNQNTFRKCVVVMMIHVIDPITVKILKIRIPCYIWVGL